MALEERELDALGQLVQSRFDKARAAKQPHHAVMVDCMRMMHGKPLVKTERDAPDIVMDIASPIVKNVTALLLDVFSGSAIAAPYTISPTPVVELPQETEAALLEAVQGELETMVLMAGGDVASVRGQIEDMRQTLLLEENRKAAQAAETLTTTISDRLHDAGWAAEFASFITHFCIYPAAVMKAPAHKEELTPTWNANSVELRQQVVRKVEVVSPFDFYPAPYAADIQSADYVIERRRMTRNELLSLRNAAGYHADTIDEIMEDKPDGAPIAYSVDETDPATDTFGVDGSERDVYDALGYYGRIRNDTLAEYGIEFAESELSASSEAEVWVVAGRVIKCLLNPNPFGRRPFYKASFERVPGSFWGTSPAMKLMDTQRVCTASVRALVRNLQYSSGPIGEVVKERVKDGLSPAQIIPNTIRLVADDNGLSGGAPAYRFHTVPSLSSELTALFERFLGYGYETLGVPRMAFGSTADLGQVGRTSGGMSIILNQATKSIKHALRTLETECIEPVVQDFVDYEVRTSSDPSVRGDVRVYARGVSGLLERESQTADLEWALQSLVPLAGMQDPATGQMVIPASAIQRLLYQIFKNKGIPTQGIFPDFDREEAFSELMSATAQPTDPAAGMPALDGRSATAAQAIDQANAGI